MANETRRAYHEAGHLVAAIHQGVSVSGATIMPTEDYTKGIIGQLDELLHSIKWNLSDSLVNRVEKYIRVCMGGGCSERFWKFGGFRVAHVQTDHKIAADLLKRICAPNKFDSYWKLLDRQTTDLLEKHWEFVEYTVHQLIESKTLSDERCRQLGSDFMKAATKTHVVHTWEDLLRNMRSREQWLRRHTSPEVTF